VLANLISSLANFACVCGSLGVTVGMLGGSGVVVLEHVRVALMLGDLLEFHSSQSSWKVFFV
jgi:hypothetical protein